MNGLWDGSVSRIAYSAEYDYNFDLSFTANNGVVDQDLTQEYSDFVNGNAGSFDASEYVSEGEKAYAYDVHWYTVSYYDENGNFDGDDATTWTARYLYSPVVTTYGIVGFAEWYY